MLPMIVQKAIAGNPEPFFNFKSHRIGLGSPYRAE
jgi:hypothetical protein